MYSVFGFLATQEVKAAGVWQSWYSRLYVSLFSITVIVTTPRQSASLFVGCKDTLMQYVWGRPLQSNYVRASSETAFHIMLAMV